MKMKLFVAMMSGSGSQDNCETIVTINVEENNKKKPLIEQEQNNNFYKAFCCFVLQKHAPIPMCAAGQNLFSSRTSQTAERILQNQHTDGIPNMWISERILHYLININFCYVTRLSGHAHTVAAKYGDTAKKMEKKQRCTRLSRSEVHR